jgi:hypothetical protein
MGLERGPLSLVGIIEEILGRHSSGSRLESPEYGRGGTVALTTRHPVSAKVGINFADKRLSLADYGQGFIIISYYYISEFVKFADYYHNFRTCGKMAHNKAFL